MSEFYHVTACFVKAVPAGRVLAVKLEYGLTVDPPEACALEAMLEGCRIEDVLRPYRPEPSS